MTTDEYYDEKIHAMVYLNYLPDDLRVGYHKGVNVEKIVLPKMTKYVVTSNDEEGQIW